MLLEYFILGMVINFLMTGNFMISPSFFQKITFGDKMFIRCTFFVGYMYKNFLSQSELFHVSFQGARCEVIEVLAEAGSQAVLPCKCKPSTRYSPNIMWVKANQG